MKKVNISEYFVECFMTGVEFIFVDLIYVEFESDKH